MTVAIIIVAVSVISLVCILGFTISRGLQISARGDFAPRIQPIDVDAFRNLLDPAEAAFLRNQLSGFAYRTVQRARLRAMAAYVSEVGRNASVLIRVGQAALAAGDPRTLQAAHDLVNEALLVRRNVAVALIKIYVALTFPHLGIEGSRIFAGYEQLTHSAMRLGRLQNPTVPVRLSARP